MLASGCLAVFVGVGWFAQLCLTWHVTLVHDIWRGLRTVVLHTPDSTKQHGWNLGGAAAGGF
jgi:hypothetical protein